MFFSFLTECFHSVTETFKRGEKWLYLLLNYDRKEYALALDLMYTRLDARALMKRGQRFVFKK